MIAMLMALFFLLAVVIVLASFRVSADADEQAEQMIMQHTPEPESTADPIAEDVYLLAKIMQCEDGVGWPDWAISCIGEVVLNRVASEHFPNTVREVLYQTSPMQYEPVHTSSWESLEPEAHYIELAGRLIDGERPIGNPDMIWQALFPQGTKTIVTFYDQVLDTTTYFCT